MSLKVLARVSQENFTNGRAFYVPLMDVEISWVSELK